MDKFQIDAATCDPLIHLLVEASYCNNWLLSGEVILTSVSPANVVDPPVGAFIHCVAPPVDESICPAVPELLHASKI